MNAARPFFWLRRLSPVHKVAAIGVGVICLLLIVTSSVAIRRYGAELKDAARELRTLDLLLAKDTGRSLQSIGLVLDALAEQLQQEDGPKPDAVATREVHESLRARAAGVPQLDAISIVGADGRLLNFSRSWPVPNIHLDDRAYFKLLRDRPTQLPYLTEAVVNRGSGTRTVYLAKRLDGLDGSFRGLILGAIELGYFERLYASLHLDLGNSIELWREDGTVLARFPTGGGVQHAAPSTFFPTTDPNFGISGVSEKFWDLDGGSKQARLVASQLIEGFPLRVDIARRKAVILKDWRREVLATGSFVLVSIICVLAMTWALIRRFKAYETVAAAARERERAILARQEAEDALRQAQKMEAVGQLTGGVAHDFNNLLTVIGSSVELLRRDNVSAERQTRYIDAIADASARAAKLTAQLLAFARRQALKPEIFDVGGNVTAVGQMIDRLTGSRVEVVTTLPSVPCHVHADPNQFDTSIVNLAINARDAMPDGGRLLISVRRTTQLPATSTSAGREGAFVAVSVTDTGVGIPPEMQDRVFEPFFTTKGVGRGTGLGLSQVIGFAKQSGGDVSIDSAPGRGSTFTLHLPLASVQAPVARPKMDFASIADGRGARVLVIDDDPQVVRLTAQLMRELKYFSVTLDNASDALDLLEEDPGGFDAVFSDVVMPGMDGVTLARVIRETYPDLPVILSTGFSATLAEEGAGDFSLLHKPFGIEELAFALHKAMETRARPPVDLGAQATSSHGGSAATRAS